jgi:hypothetical protein
MERKDDNPIRALEPYMGSAPVAPAHGIAAIALTMAMKYHEINTIQDGALYQQYKLEGRNMLELHLDIVFETAIKIERHLLASSDRIAKVICDALGVTVEDEPDAAENAGLTAHLQEE